jgi:NAD(P)-dependent dehydrogenase (short-subunit alcohol dehydrogenase family)
MSDRPSWQWRDGVAVITGGGGLLGWGMALAFARRGMDVVIADLHVEAGGVGLNQGAIAGAGQVAEEVRALGRRALALHADVSDPASVRELADAAYAEFGKVNLLCNNAGVTRVHPFEELSLDDWNTVLGVHLMGVIHGVQAFLPRMIAEGSGPRHIVNSASMSGVGLASMRTANATYVTAKFAITGLTEAMAPAIAPHGIGASVLCPGMTVADPTRPMEFRLPSAAWYKDNVLGPADVAEEVARGIEENRLHIFPHRAGLGEVEARHALLLRSFEQAAKTAPALKPRE